MKTLTKEVMIAISTVPGPREELAYALQHQIKTEDLIEPEVVVHRGVIGHQGMIENQRRAYERLCYRGAEWCLLLHEDTIPAHDFSRKIVRRLKEAREERDAVAVTFFQPGTAKDQLAAGERWFTRPGKEFMWDPALALRSDVAAKFASYSWRHDADEEHCDLMMRSFFTENDIDVHYTVPCLVEHRVDVTSTAGHGWKIFGRPRVAPSFDPDGS